MLPGAAAIMGEFNRRRGEFGERALGLIAAAALLETGPLSPLSKTDLMVHDGLHTIAVQVKTTTDLQGVGPVRRYDLEIPAYNWARVDATVSRFIVVVETRIYPTEWLIPMDWGLIVRRRAFFTSLVGAPATTNTRSITIPLPLANLVTPTSLRWLVEQFG